MKFRKAAAGILAAVMFAAGVPGISGNTGISVVSEAASKLKAPKVTLVSTVDDTVTIKWKKVSGADGYKLYMLNPAEKKYVTYGLYTDEACAVTGLKKGITYKFKLAAYIEKNGKIVPQTKTSVFKAATEKLPAPKSVRAEVTENSVKLTWDKVEGAEKYKVFRYEESSKTYKPFDTAESEEYTAEGLTTGTTYYYRVAAMVSDGKNYITQNISDAVTAMPKRNVELKTADATFYDKTGKPHKLSDFAGKPMVVTLWAIWSDWSSLDLKRFQKMYEEYKDDVEFIIIDRDPGQEREHILEFLDRYGYTFEPYFDNHNEVNKYYGEDVVPTTFTISKDGEWIETVRHSLTEKDMENLIERAKRF